MQHDQLVQRLMTTFIGELAEHLRAFNRDLLALEKESAAPGRAALLTSLFRTAHSLKGAARAVGIGVIEAACHQLEEIFGQVRDGKLPLSADLFRLLFTATDAINEVGQRLGAHETLAGVSLAGIIPRLTAASQGKVEKDGPSAGSSSLERPTPGLVGGYDTTARVSPEKLDTLVARSHELLIARRRADAVKEDVADLQEFVDRWRSEWQVEDKAVRRLLQEPNPQGRPVQREATSSQELAAVVIAAAKEKLRKLQEGLDRVALGFTIAQRAIERSAGSLEEEVRSISMVPFSQACEGLDRAIRDLAAASAKQVRLLVRGGDVELDRLIVDRLRDPLLHLVRNAIDHGIELPEVRQGLNKSPEGLITVAAALTGSQVTITVEDDGRGLDIPAIRERAHQKGIATSLDDLEMARLIFVPGFSTSAVVTESSGRGIGLDVVRDQAESLHGTIDISYWPGQGARFTLLLPLTLTTVRALLVAAGEQTFALVDTNVHTLLRVGVQEIRSVAGRDAVLLNESAIPIAPLARVLGLENQELTALSGKVPLVIVASGNRRGGIAVDELLAEEEVVVKTLGPRLAGVKCFSGATILPTGRIALILNAADLLDRIYNADSPAGKAVLMPDAAPEYIKKRIVVAEDSVTTRTLMKSILETAGYHVLAAADGAEAWQLLQERGADLVVSDVEMPRVDGFALTATIRNSKRFRDLPVILVTARETETDRARGMDVGADAYLLKSAFDQRNLLETIITLV